MIHVRAQPALSARPSMSAIACGTTTGTKSGAHSISTGSAVNYFAASKKIKHKS
jgi:hypothetical protein